MRSRSLPYASLAIVSGWLLLSCGSAQAYSGSCAIWAQPRNKFIAASYPGNQAGFDAAKAAVGTNGAIFIYGGCEGLLTIGTLQDSVFVYAYDSAKWTVYGKAGSWRDRSGQARLDVDSTGIKVTGTGIIPRLGPASSAGSGGAIRIVDGVTFTTLAQALADKVGGAAGTRGGVVDPDSARFFLGRFANNTTLNDPALDRARSVFSHDISIQGLNIPETEAAHSWQTVWSGNGITGAAGFDRAVAGEWHDHELAAGAGNGLNLFRGEAHVASVNSTVFEKDMTGFEFDTIYKPATTDTINSMVGLYNLAVVQGAGNLTANALIGLDAVAGNNGTGRVAAIRGLQTDVQLSGTNGADNIQMIVPYDVTGGGTLGSGGNVYDLYIPAHTFAGYSGGGRQIPIFIASGAGPAVLSDSLRVNKGLYVGGQFVNKIDGGSASLNFGAPAAVPGSVDLAITVAGAAFGDKVCIGSPVTIGANYLLTGFVSAANTVTIRWTQIAGAAADPDGAGGTYTVGFLR